MKCIKVIKLSLTKPAARRLQQLGLSRGDLNIVLRFGRRIRRSNVTFYVFSQRQIPTGCQRQLKRLVGTTAVVIGDRIITVYRNPRAIANLKRKRKRERAKNCHFDHGRNESPQRQLGGNYSAGRLSSVRSGMFIVVISPRHRAP